MEIFVDGQDSQAESGNNYQVVIPSRKVIKEIVSRKEDNQNGSDDYLKDDQNGSEDCLKNGNGMDQMTKSFPDNFNHQFQKKMMRRNT